MRSSILSLILISFFLCSSAASQATLRRGSSLRVEQHDQDFLISPDKAFSCGFYQVGTNAYSFSIWFTNATDKAVVWTANRDSPVNGRASEISLLKDGNLVLTDVDGSTVWNANTSYTGVSMAELLNTGNLVLKDRGGKIVWESFASLTDTLLPSQPLTKGKRLISPIAKGALGSGYYNLYFDNDNILRLMYDGPEISSIYWPSTDYTVYQNGRTNYNSTRIAVLDDTGRFLSSDGLDVRASDSGSRIKRRLTMDYDGILRMYSLNESNGSWIITWEAIIQQCNVHGICGKNGICEYSPKLRCFCPPGYEMSNPGDWSKGCKPNFTTNCNQPPEQSKFIELPQTDFYGFDLAFASPISFESCKKLCLQNCSCMGFGYRLTGTGVCFPKGSLFNGYKSPNFPGSTYLRLPNHVNVSASSLVSTQSGLTCSHVSTEIVVGSVDLYGKNRNTTKWPYLYVFASVLGGLELLFIITGWWFLFRKNRTPKSVEEGYKMISNQFRRFTYRELKEATAKFKEELGRGGSGAVYRGVLEDKKVVAVKKLTDVTQGEEEFWAEVSVIGNINHMNLVRMWGFCSEGQHRLLVYEYVENESLDKYLFDSNNNDRSLGWQQRFSIALGTAKGLAYLHHECLEWVIHCDVKPENILLTRDFEAKIADFGLAKLSKRDGSGFNFSKIRGTMGYMAPEWALNLPITAKVDVYSYGVVLLEIVTGRRIFSWMTENGKQMDIRGFIKEVKQVFSSGEILSMTDIVDARLRGQINHKQAEAMVRISISCLEEERSNRPSMDEIVKALMACEEQDHHPAYSM
ncbi:putative receptor protein kinase ZmPK1 [Typha angustifolia]|uniref:putative receptor protein kinase ZmPK1 n=1 Tax=Typha angustifolia TaxID=59011 RepID=UPI003C2FF347